MSGQGSIRYSLHRVARTPLLQDLRISPKACCCVAKEHSVEYRWYPFGHSNSRDRPAMAKKAIEKRPLWSACDVERLWSASLCGHESTRVHTQQRVHTQRDVTRSTSHVERLWSASLCAHLLGITPAFPTRSGTKHLRATIARYLPVLLGSNCQFGSPTLRRQSSQVMYILHVRMSGCVVEIQLWYVYWPLNTQLVGSGRPRRRQWQSWQTPPAAA